MLQVAEDKRYTAVQVLDHSWVNVSVSSVLSPESASIPVTLRKVELLKYGSLYLSG